METRQRIGLYLSIWGAAAWIVGRSGGDQSGSLAVIGVVVGTVGGWLLFL